MPRPCVRHRRTDARNEIAAPARDDNPKTARSSGCLFSLPPELAFLLAGTHPDANIRQALTMGKSSTHRSSRRARRPLTQPRSPCRDSTYGTPLPCTKALRRPRATRSGTACEELTCSTPLPCTEALHRPRTQKTRPRRKSLRNRPQNTPARHTQPGSTACECPAPVCTSSVPKMNYTRRHRTRRKRNMRRIFAPEKRKDEQRKIPKPFFSSCWGCSRHSVPSSRTCICRRSPR